MNKYFSKRTILYVIISTTLAILYSIVFGFSFVEFINGLTLLTCINALIALGIHSRSKGDFAMFNYKNQNVGSYNEYKKSIVDSSKNKNNFWFGSFITLLILLIVINIMY